MGDPTIPELAAWCRQAARLEDATALQASPLYAGVFIDNATRLRAIAAALERAERLEAALERMQWRPIAEAPRDGTTIIVGCHMPAWGWVQGWARWDGAAGIYGWISRGFFDPPGNLGLGHPTHFMPLRPPPAEKETDR